MGAAKKGGGWLVFPRLWVGDHRNVQADVPLQLELEEPAEGHRGDRNVAPL